MSEREELLPCPFCGAEATAVEYVGAVWPEVDVIVGCNNQECPIEPHTTGLKHYRAALIADWNRRAAADSRAAAAEAQVKVLLEALIWCSGSPDFNEGGQARQGWIKVCAPLLASAKEAGE